MAAVIFAVLCLLQAADVYTTLRAIKLGAVEGNPILAKLLGKRPKAAGLLAVKLALTYWIGWELSGAGWQPDSTYIVAMVALCAVLAWAAHNNLGVIRKLQAK